MGGIGYDNYLEETRESLEVEDSRYDLDPGSAVGLGKVLVGRFNSDLSRSKLSRAVKNLLPLFDKCLGGSLGGCSYYVTFTSTLDYTGSTTGIADILVSVEDSKGIYHELALHINLLDFSLKDVTTDTSGVTKSEAYNYVLQSGCSIADRLITTITNNKVLRDSIDEVANYFSDLPYLAYDVTDDYALSTEAGNDAVSHYSDSILADFGVSFHYHMVGSGVSGTVDIELYEVPDVEAIWKTYVDDEN